jgi:hypothetical protein
MHHTTDKGGFIKMIIIIIIAISALWYFKIDVRGLSGIQPQTRYKYVYRAKVDFYWYGFYVWYDKQTLSSKPIGWIQDKINKLASPNSTTTPTSTI